MSTPGDETLPFLDAKQRIPILSAHYERVLPYLLPIFAGTPLVTAFYPHGLDEKAHFIGELHKTLVPKKIPTQLVRSATGTHAYVTLGAEAIAWLVREKHAVGFATWAPIRADARRMAYARISLHPANLATQTQLAQAMLAVRAALQTHRLDAIPLFDGSSSAVLWIPFADAPEYPPVLAWSALVIGEVVREHPELTTIAPEEDAGDRIRLVIGSNRVGRFSSLPYAIGGTPDLTMITPSRWDELPNIPNGTVTAQNSARRFEETGDLFGEASARLSAQRFADVAQPTRAYAISLAAIPARNDVRGSNIRAAVAILQDGKTRDADEILAEAIARGLLSKAITRKHLYIALTEYIARTRGNGRVPLIAQDERRAFRINRPADDWPQPHEPLPAPAPIAQANALVSKLRSTGAGADPTAFEQAVCESFAALGFIATHEGGNDKPDGYIDAPLGPLGYRVMLECKSARGQKVTQPDAPEAARWVAAYHARFAALIGPAFGNDAQLAEELQTHRVSAWTIDDLATAFSLALNAFEAQAAFAPGFAADALATIAWERAHGRAKRVRVIAEQLVTIGMREQSATAGDPSDAPVITQDAAMLLIDDELREEGAATHCAREDVSAAFDYLTHPLVARAVRANESGIIIVAIQ